MRTTSAAWLCVALFGCALSAQNLISDAPDAGSAPSARPTSSAPTTTSPSPAAASTTNYFVYERARGDAWKWFAAPPYKDEYRYLQTLFRAGIAHRDGAWDWELEMEQAAVLDASSDSVSAVTAQGQLGFAGTYYASNGNNSYPAAASFKQG